jgi:hypothetical protein
MMRFYVDMAVRERLPLPALDKGCGQRRGELAQPCLN